MPLRILISILLLLFWYQTKCQDRGTAEKYFAEANQILKSKKSDSVERANIIYCIELYRKAIVFDTTFWQAYRNRSRLNERLGQFNQTISDLTIALKYADSSSAVNLHDMRAYSYYALGHYQQAINDWSVAVDNLGNPSFALLQRAKAYWQLGQKDKSCVDYRAAIKLDKSLEEKKEFIRCD